MQQWYDIRASVANVLLRNFDEFTMQKFCDTHVLRKHANTSRRSGEKIKLSDIRTNVMQHLHECHATVVQMKMKISHIRGNAVRHSHECLATVTQLSRDIRDIYFKNIPKLVNLSHICPFNETAT